MVGGPDSVPDFLKEDEELNLQEESELLGDPIVEPTVIQEPENMEPMDGGPDTVPDFLKEKDEELNL